MVGGIKRVCFALNLKTGEQKEKKKKMFNMEEKQIFASVGKGDLQCYLARNSAAGQAHPVVNHLLTGKRIVPAGYGKGTQQ